MQAGSSDGNVMNRSQANPKTASKFGSANINIGTAERAASVLIGAAIFLVLRRKLLPYLGALGIAGYLLYRGVSGRCLIYEAMEMDTSDFDLSDLTEGDLNLSQMSRSDKSDNEKAVPEDMEDEVDEALVESFPASDPPGNW